MAGAGPYRDVDTHPPPLPLGIFAPPLGEILTCDLADRVGAFVGAPLRPANSFYRLYLAGDLLARHFDRDKLDVTVTLMIRLVGTQSWPISARIGDDTVSLPMGSGDAVLLTGRSIPHWREPLAAGHCASMLLHWSLA